MHESVQSRWAIFASHSWYISAPLWWRSFTSTIFAACLERFQVNWNLYLSALPEIHRTCNRWQPTA